MHNNLVITLTGSKQMGLAGVFLDWILEYQDHVEASWMVRLGGV